MTAGDGDTLEMMTIAVVRWWGWIQQVVFNQCRGSQQCWHLLDGDMVGSRAGDGDTRDGQVVLEMVTPKRGSEQLEMMTR